MSAKAMSRTTIGPGAYARFFAQHLIAQQANKRLFGKAYFKLGQCLWLWAYLFQVGGILAVKHIANIDAFGCVFLGVRGAAGAVKNFFDQVAQKCVSLGRVSSSITFFQYIEAEFTQRVGTTGDNYFLAHGMDKLPLDIAEELACQYGEQGAAVGATHPDIIRAMFERTYAPVPKEEWNKAYAAGLDIGPEQPHRNFEDVQETENTPFVAYSKDYRPDLYPIFTAHSAKPKPSMSAEEFFKTRIGKTYLEQDPQEMSRREQEMSRLREKYLGDKSERENR